MRAAREEETDLSHAIETVIPVRWRDMDAFGHVNHAVFLTYLEEARDAAIRQVLGGAGYVMARLTIDYRQELRHTDGPVTVACRFTTIGNSSLGTRETMRNAAGELVAESEAIIVRFDSVGRRPQRWSEDERRALAAAGAAPRVMGDG